MKKLFIINAILILIALSSCDSPNSPNVDSSVIMPLKVGNTWIFNVKTLNKDGILIDSGLDTFLVKGYAELQGIKGYFISPMEDYLFQNESDGLHVYELGDTINNNLFFKYPGHLNDKWTVSVKDGKYELSISEVDKLIKVEAGEFKCINYAELYVYEVPESTLIRYYKTYYYLSPNIGFVKTETYYSEDGNNYFLVRTTELKSYKLL